MTKHTPGPWEITRFQDPCFEGDDREYAAIDGPTVRVARIIGAVKVHPPAPHEENEANACLISAAPEMLAALKECLKAEMERRKKLLPGAPATTYCEARIARIRAAIAKAEGRAP